MASINDIVIVLYLAGEDEEDALGSFPWDSYETAWNHANEFDPPLNIYTVSCRVDASSVELVKGWWK